MMVLTEDQERELDAAEIAFWNALQKDRGVDFHSAIMNADYGATLSQMRDLGELSRCDDLEHRQGVRAIIALGIYGADQKGGE
jgi:hypothetical protein